MQPEFLRVPSLCGYHTTLGHAALDVELEQITFIHLAY